MGDMCELSDPERRCNPTGSHGIRRRSSQPGPCYTPARRHAVRDRDAGRVRRRSTALDMELVCQGSQLPGDRQPRDPVRQRTTRTAASSSTPLQVGGDPLVRLRHPDTQLARHRARLQHGRAGQAKRRSTFLDAAAQRSTRTRRTCSSTGTTLVGRTATRAPPRARLSRRSSRGWTSSSPRTPTSSSGDTTTCTRGSRRCRETVRTLPVCSASSSAPAATHFASRPRFHKRGTEVTLPMLRRAPARPAGLPTTTGRSTTPQRRNHLTSGTT